MAIEGFVERWAAVYAGVRRGEATLVAMAAAHQRLGWIHPFVDGNGRVMRLHTHTLLSALGYTGGLWSPLRGFARTVDRYCACLAAADEPRRGDLDGRGKLIQSALAAWIDYVLDVCLDQVAFMRSMLNLATMEGRIAACLSFEQASLKSGVRLDALRPLHYLFLSGAEIERGEFKRMTGLGEHTAVNLLRALVQRGLLSPTHHKARSGSGCRCMRCASTFRHCGLRLKQACPAEATHDHGASPPCQPSNLFGAIPTASRARTACRVGGCAPPGRDTLRIRRGFGWHRRSKHQWAWSTSFQATRKPRC